MIKREDLWYDSCTTGSIHACRWLPEGKPKAVVQIVHGMTEYAARYDHFARFLADQGYVTAAEDHSGHGLSLNEGDVPECFRGGWFSVAEDTLRLTGLLKKEYPGLPLVLLGHSLGSFLARTMLYLEPDCADVAILSGTAWQPDFLMPGLVKLMETACRIKGDAFYNIPLQNLAFNIMNARVEHPRTNRDWVCRSVWAVNEDVQLHFGLLRDMVIGIQAVQQKENIGKMKKALPVLFVAGSDDPVGNYGKGVQRCAGAFRNAGLQDVTVRLYPLCRHEVLNELNRKEVYSDILSWMEQKIN